MFGLKNPCAWCPLSEETPQEGQSHGICPEHAQQLQDQSDARHFKDVPSYISEKEQFEQYKERKSR